jgi:hypothetical protein
MPDKIMVTDSRSLLQNGTQKYAKRYSNGSIEYFGFSTQAEAEEFLKQKKDTETLKESTPFKNELATAQTIDKSGNKATDQINNMPAPIVDDVINVIRDYDWTYSKNKIKKWIDIPYVELNEFKLAGNSYLSSLMTSALLFPDILESSYGENTLVNNFYQTLKKDFEKNEFGKFMGSLGENANKVTDSPVANASAYFDLNFSGQDMQMSAPVAASSADSQSQEAVTYSELELLAAAYKFLKK